MCITIYLEPHSTIYLHSGILNMSTPNERLAASLDRLRRLQQDGRRVFRSAELTRVHRERLKKNGFLREIIKGWLMSASPGSGPGDTTPWFASFWEFCAAYCIYRFGDDWHLSPEQSLMLHAENATIPQQVIVHAPGGANNRIDLPFNTSLFDLGRKAMPPDADLAVDGPGLRVFRPEAALVRVPEGFFVRNPIEARVAIAGIRDPADVLGRLLRDGNSTVAGRLAGAFRRTGRDSDANEILSTMKSAGYDVRETDPFEPTQTFSGLATPQQPPVVGRLRLMWETFREPVIRIFPEAPRLPEDPEAYLAFVDDIYPNDAYHSLSIEGYRVTPELIERVRAGNWNPDADGADRQSHDAMAARGYWQAFRLVRHDIAEITAGANPGPLVASRHREWYRELFQPGVQAGIAEPAALAGYRNTAVFLRGSRYVPPRHEAVRDAMLALFDLLGEESEPSVRAVLGHWLFGYIHPYADGNGRMARFLMNAMLASGGYPWTVTPVDRRAEYLSALEQASVHRDVEPFACFVASQVEWSMDWRHARMAGQSSAPSSGFLDSRPS